MLTLGTTIERGKDAFGGVFSELRDRRGARGKRYGLEPLLCAIVLSMLAGANSLRKIEAFIDERLEPLNLLLGTNWRKVPSWVGIRRFLLEIDANELESAIRTHARGVASPPAGRQFIAGQSHQETCVPSTRAR